MKLWVRETALAALGTALLGSTALAADAVQPPAEEALNLSLGATAGVWISNLPDYNAYYTDDGPVGLDDPTIGVQLGLSGSVALGNYDDWAMSLGLSGFVGYGQRSLDQTQTFDGQGYVIIPGITLPPGAMELEARWGDAAPDSSDNTANVTDGVILANAAGTNADGALNVAAVTIGAGPSFVYSAFNSQQDNGPANGAASYGAIATPEGGLFVGVGDLTGLEITTSIVQETLSAGGDLTIAFAKGLDETSAIQAYTGPSYRMLGQRGSKDVTVDIPEIAPFTPGFEFPTYAMSTEEELLTHYAGAVVGVSYSHLITDGIVFNVGAELGAYYAATSYSGSETYSVFGGEATDGLGVPIGPIAATTVTNDGLEIDENGIAWAARGSASISVAIADNMQVVFTGTGEYLSRAAGISHDDALAAVVIGAPAGLGADETGTTADYAGGGGGGTSLSYSGVWNFGGSVSLVGQF
ncbi:hypothetical protein [Devosia sp.]|uniref:hypothetical protein n=1 Tax=Devosia sp. TaxID=1871048 RepID=UPI0035AEA9D9